MGILETKKIVLLNYPLGLSLLKYKNVWVFWNKKKSGLNMCNPLNSSIEDPPTQKKKKKLEGPNLTPSPGSHNDKLISDKQSYKTSQGGPK